MVYDVHSFVVVSWQHLILLSIEVQSHPDLVGVLRPVVDVDFDLILNQLGMLHLSDHNLALSLQAIGKTDDSLARLVSLGDTTLGVDLDDTLVAGRPDGFEVTQILDFPRVIEELEVH